MMNALMTYTADVPAGVVDNQWAIYIGMLVGAGIITVVMVHFMIRKEK